MTPPRPVYCAASTDAAPLRLSDSVTAAADMLGINERTLRASMVRWHDGWRITPRQITHRLSLRQWYLAHRHATPAEAVAATGATHRHAVDLRSSLVRAKLLSPLPRERRAYLFNQEAS